jgi:hypothetical protein
VFPSFVEAYEVNPDTISVSLQTRNTSDLAVQAPLSPLVPSIRPLVTFFDLQFGQAQMSRLRPHDPLSGAGLPLNLASTPLVTGVRPLSILIESRVTIASTLEPFQQHRAQGEMS